MSIMDEIKKDIEKTYEYKCGYQQGRADREKEVLNYLVENGYIKYGFDANYLAEQLKEQTNEYEANTSSY